MPAVLTKIKITEVSGVGKGAGEGVRVMLMKGDDSDGGHFDLDGVSAEALMKAVETHSPAIRAACQKALDAENVRIDAFMKREFDTKKRKELASSGKAMEDGSFPIENEEDLHNAIRAIGRSKNPAKAKAHIIARAQAMGDAGVLPESWTGKKDVKKSFLDQFLAKIGVRKGGGMAADFDTVHEGTELYEYADGMMEEIREAICDLQESICSIICDPEITDKQKMLDETFSQFKEHIQTVTPEALEKAMAAADLVATGIASGGFNKGEIDMNAEELTKAIEAAVAKAVAPLQKTVDEQQAALNIAKLSPAQLDYVTKTAMTPEQKAAFAAKNDKDKDDEVKKFVEKSAGDPAIVAVNKSIEELSKSNDNLREQLAKRDEADALAVVVKRVEGYGFGADVAKSIYELEKAGKKAEAAAIEKSLKASAEGLKTAGIFKEFGGVGHDTTASDQIDLLVKELQKANPNMTRDQAISKIAEMPAHQEVWKAYKEASVSPLGKRLI